MGSVTHSFIHSLIHFTVKDPWHNPPQFPYPAIVIAAVRLSLQAREDIIHMLKTERTQPESLEAQYGSAVPVTPLQALQRDNMLTCNGAREDDVYEIPMMEVRTLNRRMHLS